MFKKCYDPIFCWEQVFEVDFLTFSNFNRSNYFSTLDGFVYLLESSGFGKNSDQFSERSFEMFIFL